MAHTTFTREVYLSPEALNMNARALGADRTSETIDMSGANGLLFQVSYARSAGTGDLDFEFDVFDTAINGWQAVTEPGSPTAGVFSPPKLVIRRATGSANQVLSFELSDFMDLGGVRKLRFRVINPAAATSADTVTVACVRHYSQA